ncbi:hypothetical protein, partial [Leisingera sp. MMG026]|uniref:hypothetical protein n=1 Tax=Leisingera sp. MMG026 TaxID=2909982 RepID=UPI001F3C36D5
KTQKTEITRTECAGRFHDIGKTFLALRLRIIFLFHELEAQFRICGAVRYQLILPGRVHGVVEFTALVHTELHRISNRCMQFSASEFRENQ